MPISDLIKKIRTRIDEPSFPDVTEWKRNHPGCKAVGYFPVYVPVEMIHAAGMLPVLLAGAGGNIKRDDADGYLQSFICSIGRSTLELLFDGYLEHFDALIFPSVCEISRGLSSVMERHSDDKPIIYIHYPQNLESSFAVDYLVNELGRVRGELENLSGSKITDEAILSSFAIYSRRADLIEKLDLYRSDYPDRFSASEFYILRLAGMTLSIEDHIKLLESALAELESAPAHHEVRLRMILTGAFCERPPVTMFEIMEEKGYAIVADDILLGQRWWTEPLPASGDPLRILAEHYIRHAVRTSFVYHPVGEPSDTIEKVLRERNADGVIVSSPIFCHVALHDVGSMVAVCEKNGFPFIRLEYQEIQRVFGSTRVQLEALLEARERLPFAGTDNGKGEPV